MKKYLAVLTALVLALALPVAAFAEGSPTNATATGSSNGVTLSVTGGNGLKVAAASKNAQGTPAGANVVASFEVTGEANGTLTLTFNVGTKYAGAKATVYVQHNDGATETKSATVASDGTVTITVDRLSVFTVVIDESSKGTATTDKSSKSPQTGVSTSAVQVATAVAVVAAAGCAAVVVRKVSAR